MTETAPICARFEYLSSKAAEIDSLIAGEFAAIPANAQIHQCRDIASRIGSLLKDFGVFVNFLEALIFYEAERLDAVLLQTRVRIFRMKIKEYEKKIGEVLALSSAICPPAHCFSAPPLPPHEDVNASGLHASVHASEHTSVHADGIYADRPRTPACYIVCCVACLSRLFSFCPSLLSWVRR